jgi:deoxyribodipyrimidine photo-lyase
VWFRRDLRCIDHAALCRALERCAQVYCAFVFDTDILDRLRTRADRRVEFVREAVVELDAALERLGGGLIALHGRACEAIPALAHRLGVQAVFANHDYEPHALARDAAVERSLRATGCRFFTFKDQVIFEKDEVLSAAGTPFRVFTPYRKAWLAKLRGVHLAAYPVERHARRLARPPQGGVPALAELGFQRTNLAQLGLPTGMSGGRALLDDFLTRIGRYRERRDYPALNGPSYLSAHLRFGTVSVRELARAACARASRGAALWLSELTWRDFYFMILYHHPHVVERAFRVECDALRFENRGEWFAAWCEGRTGYPLVDAAMRQINRTGYMHNRLRMLVASFLVKDLLVDWRWGERYFAEHLNDFDLAANNGGWQWAASTGCDAQPYFRIFNPVTQSERFDPRGRFIRLYLPELARVPDRNIHAPWTMSPAEQSALGVVIGRDYPVPIVDHAQQRKKALALYARVREKRGARTEQAEG